MVYVVSGGFVAFEELSSELRSYLGNVFGEFASLGFCISSRLGRWRLPWLRTCLGIGIRCDEQLRLFKAPEENARRVLLLAHSGPRFKLLLVGLALDFVLAIERLAKTLVANCLRVDVGREREADRTVGVD